MFTPWVKRTSCFRLKKRKTRHALLPKINIWINDSKDVSTFRSDDFRNTNTLVKDSMNAKKCRFLKTIFFAIIFLSAISSFKKKFLGNLTNVNIAIIIIFIYVTSLLLFNIVSLQIIIAKYNSNDTKFSVSFHYVLFMKLKFAFQQTIIKR